MRNPGAGAHFAIGSALLALWGASRGAVALSGALNAMFNKKETRPWWKRQLLAIGLTFAVAILVVVALGLLVVDNFTYTLESLIQAGKMLVAVDQVEVATNPQTRESRLFDSTGGYVRRNTL